MLFINKYTRSLSGIKVMSLDEVIMHTTSTAPYSGLGELEQMRYEIVKLKEMVSILALVLPMEAQIELAEKLNYVRVDDKELTVP